MVIINADMRLLFAELLAMADEGHELLLARADGEVLLHGISPLTFRVAIGGPELDTVLASGQHGDTDTDKIVGYRSITLGPSKDPYTLAITRPMSGLLDTLRRKRDELTVLFAGVAFGAITLIALFGYSIQARLNRLTGLMERYAVGSHEELPTDRDDEFGRLTRGFRTMQERIDVRVRELETSRSAAEESDRQRRELLANMSHEVRTPLNAIIGMSDGIDTARLDPTDRERMAIVRRSALRLKGLVDDLLTHARIGEGKLPLHFSNVDVRTLVQDILVAHTPTANEKALRIRIELGDLPKLVHTDGLRLHQVIDNLVGNAVRFTTAGEVVIAADVVDGKMLRILVWDTGPGIPPEAQQRIFERFERATSSEQAHGAGLGLAITKRVVDLLGGSIELDSTPGHGSRFIVRLPVALAGDPVILDADKAPIAGSPRGVTEARYPLTTSGLSILYVEDVATNRMLIRSWAQQWEWKLTLAETGEEALAACEGTRFDVLLIDLGLGSGISGLELASRLRAGTPHRFTPMITLTAYVEEGEDGEALKAGMNDRVTKPVDRDSLLGKVEFWCDRSEQGEGVPDLAPLAAQYDHDAEKLVEVFARYRTEFIERRLALRAALDRGDAQALSEVRHTLRPHWQLLGMQDALATLDRLTTLNAAQCLPELEHAFRLCDRAFLGALRAPVTAV